MLLPGSAQAGIPGARLTCQTDMCIQDLHVAVTVHGCVMMSCARSDREAGQIEAAAADLHQQAVQQGFRPALAVDRTSANAWLGLAESELTLGRMAGEQLVHRGDCCVCMRLCSGTLLSSPHSCKIQPTCIGDQGCTLPVGICTYCSKLLFWAPACCSPAAAGCRTYLKDLLCSLSAALGGASAATTAPHTIKCA